MISSDVMSEIIEGLKTSKYCYQESDICMKRSVAEEAKSNGLVDEADALLAEVFDNVNSTNDLKQIYELLGIQPIKHSTFNHKSNEDMTFDDWRENAIWDIKNYFKGYRRKW